MALNPFQPQRDQREPYLPTFEEVMQTYEYEDSMRLPTYQGRPLGRFHPYRRPFPYQLVKKPSLRFLNTIYDEECIFLGAVPPLHVVPVVPHAGPHVDAVIDHLAPEPQNEVDHVVRRNHFGSAAMGVQHAVAATQPEADFVVDPELDHATPVLVPVPTSLSQGKV